MSRLVASIALAAFLSGCAGMIEMPKKRTLEQEAIRTAVGLCKAFGHPPQSETFVECAERRFDEYMNHRR